MENEFRNFAGRVVKEAELQKEGRTWGHNPVRNKGVLSDQ